MSGPSVVKPLNGLVGGAGELGQRIGEGAAGEEPGFIEHYERGRYAARAGVRP